MRETTTSTRRVIISKVKTRPNQRQLKQTPSRPYTPEPRAVPLLFDRLSSPHVRIAIPAPWWNDWKVIALTIIMVLAIACAIYFATRSSESHKRTPPRNQHTPDGLCLVTTFLYWRNASG
ncbi:MAG: hypothetical protein J0653_05060 [Deltaproteobacteria bacterium]|nr:hypothetical protein [Deltaproteobacteria bacterium]